jgi:2-haloacid dehalogenase
VDQRHDHLVLNMHRRAFLGAIAVSLGTAPLAAAANKTIRAVAFDAFVVFDARTIIAGVQEALGDRGTAFVAAWFQKLFGDTWLLTAAGRYQPFEEVADASLAATAEAAGLALSGQTRSDLVQRFSRLDVWPDVPPALAKLHAAGIRTCILSNLSEGLLAASLKRSGLASSFEAVLSTDQVRHFKPAPAAYAMAPRALALPATEIAFAAFGGWDAVGATWFGFRTAWVNRSGAAREWLDVVPEITSSGMDGILALAGIG